MYTIHRYVCIYIHVLQIWDLIKTTKDFGKIPLHHRGIEEEKRIMNAQQKEGMKGGIQNHEYTTYNSIFSKTGIRKKEIRSGRLYCTLHRCIYFFCSIIFTVSMLVLYSKIWPWTVSNSVAVNLIWVQNQVQFSLLWIGFRYRIISIIEILFVKNSNFTEKITFCKI